MARSWFKPKQRTWSFPPPCAEGRREAPGWGSLLLREACPATPTPTPNPSPQGGGEPTETAARVSINHARSFCSAPLSRRLLRRHLLHLARGEIEAHALDLVEVGPGHAHEAGIVGIVDRMDSAVLIDAGVSGQQAIFLDRLELGLFRVGVVVLALPLDHVGVVGGLAIDRPGRAVVVRRRDAGLVIDMRKNLKAEVRILVEHLEPARHMIAAIGLDEVAVREQLLELQAHLLAALGSAVALENSAAIRHELIEVVGHGCLLADIVTLASRITAANARAYSIRLSQSLVPKVTVAS